MLMSGFKDLREVQARHLQFLEMDDQEQIKVWRDAILEDLNKAYVANGGDAPSKQVWMDIQDLYYDGMNKRHAPLVRAQVWTALQNPDTLLQKGIASKLERDINDIVQHGRAKSTSTFSNKLKTGIPIQPDLNVFPETIQDEE